MYSCCKRSIFAGMKQIKKFKTRYSVLLVLMLVVILVQIIPFWGWLYSQYVYPVISKILIAFSSHLPFSLGDVFITLSIVALILIPIYRRIRFHVRWKRLLLSDGEYLLWIYVWFYLAWGLNYSQPNFYRRAHIAPAKYEVKSFSQFVDRYITLLNASYMVPPKEIDKAKVHDEVTRIYRQISDSLKVHTPQSYNLRVKTMLFSNFISSVGVTGYMGPFFCEFNLNGNLLPADYPATYAHEMAHLLGISNEAEANFYAYQVCTRSSDPAIRFSGYFFVMGYVLRNARKVMSDEAFNRVKRILRPEVKYLYSYQYYYWWKLYSPALGAVQNWVYDLYLKGNKIESGQKNYYQVVSLLISYEQSKRKR